MHGSKRRICSVMAILFLTLWVGSSAWAQYQGGIPWQVGHVAVCGDGNCNMLFISGNNATLLDSFHAGQSGMTDSAAMNNTMHLLVANDHGGSDIVEISIAS